MLEILYPQYSANSFEIPVICNFFPSDVLFRTNQRRMQKSGEISSTAERGDGERIFGERRLSFTKCVARRLFALPRNGPAMHESMNGMLAAEIKNDVSKILAFLNRFSIDERAVIAHGTSIATINEIINDNGLARFRVVCKAIAPAKPPAYI